MFLYSLHFTLVYWNICVYFFDGHEHKDETMWRKVTGTFTYHRPGRETKKRSRRWNFPSAESVDREWLSSHFTAPLENRTEEKQAIFLSGEIFPGGSRDSSKKQKLLDQQKRTERAVHAGWIIMISLLCFSLKPRQKYWSVNKSVMRSSSGIQGLAYKPCYIRDYEAHWLETVWPPSLAIKVSTWRSSRRD